MQMVLDLGIECEVTANGYVQVSLWSHENILELAVKVPQACECIESMWSAHCNW